MSLLPGSRLGPYAVTARIGKGGMGEVYRARDIKLDRDVALKILSESFASDPDRLMRFEREAKTLAALNHPNIAAIYGIEESGSIRALVMELVAGDDLSVLIARGAMGLSDALPIAKGIADALEAAHDAGVVHRDLKPANVKIKADGTVKVLDFGLAKAIKGDGSGTGQPDVSPSMSPTMTSPAMTEMGVVLGTAAYMAPEQARGRPVDRRADIWAFGAVLYEMLTGRRAFVGDHVSDVLVSVLRDTPDFSTLPAGTPPSLRRLLQRCLEKDPKRRLSSIGDARFELEDSDGAAPAAAVAVPPSRPRVAFALVAALSLAGIAATTAWFLKPAATLPVRLLDLPPSIAASEEVVLSPDGTRVAYFIDGHLYVRALDSLTSQDLGLMPANADTLFWSPDGERIGFQAESEIRTVPASGGPVFTVCRIPRTGQVLDAKWRGDGTIVFAVWRDSVFSVPAAGGTPVVAVAIDATTEVDVHHLSPAPGGRLIVTIHQRSSERALIALVDAHGTGASQRRTVLTDDETVGEVSYSPPAHVVFSRHGPNAGLWAAPFSDGPIDLARATLLQAGGRFPYVGQNGSLVFELPAVPAMSPVWIDRSGVVSTIAGQPVSTWRGFAISPDGRRMAIIVRGKQLALGLPGSLLVRDLATGADTQPTAGLASGLAELNTTTIGFPSWFPSGDRVLLRSGLGGTVRLVAQGVDDATPTRDVAAGMLFGRIARDGRTLAAIHDDRGRTHLVYAPLSADGVAAPHQRVLGDDDPDVDDFDLSPDGHLVVFTVRLASQRYSVFLSEFPVGTRRWQVAESATQPQFSRDGREIFYVKEGTDARGQPTSTLTSRTVSTRPSVTLGAATELFGGSSAAMIRDQGYGVAADGRRFLALKSVAPAPGEGKRFIWMQNWPALLTK